MPFPKAVNVVPAVGVAGDFCSANPRASVVTGPGAFVSGPNGVAIGAFAWADSLLTNSKVGNSGGLAPTGFVGRHMNAVITQFLADNTQIIPVGLGVTLYSEGEFFVVNNGTTASAIGQKAYANNNTGLVSFAATASPPSAATSTASTMALNNTSAGTITQIAFTASISGQIMTVSALSAGVALGAGMVLAGGTAGNPVDPATTILNQLTGSAGGAGTYTVSVSQTVASSAFTAPLWGTFLVATTITGQFLPGQVLSGTNVTTGTTIAALVSGTDGKTNGDKMSVYAPTTMAAASATSITGTGGVLTIGGTVTGTYAVGDLVTGAGINAGTYITALGTGTGGAGTYYLNQSQTITSQAINANAATETKFYALSVGQPGELVKMSSWPLG